MAKQHPQMAYNIKFITLSRNVRSCNVNSYQCRIYITGEQMPLQTIPHSQLHSHLHSLSFKTTLVSLVLAIVLPIASIYGDIFDSKLCDFGGFHDELNVLNNEWEKWI